MTNALLSHAQKRNPLAHTDGYVQSTPGLLDVLNELSEMAVELAPAMDNRAIPNVCWAMGMIRKNLLGAWVKTLVSLKP